MSKGKKKLKVKKKERVCAQMKLGSKKQLLSRGSGVCIGTNSRSSAPLMVGMREARGRAGPRSDAVPSSLSRIGSSSGDEPQDADYSVAPLSDELETLIVARFPRSEYWKFSLMSKRFSNLVKSEELYKIRRAVGSKEPSVFMFVTGETTWRAFDRQFRTCRRLPILPADACFGLADKETVCAGTHLIVSGKEFGGISIWRYELVANEWIKGPSMINPRCLFASATCGDSAFVAGGMETGTENEEQVLSSAEKYDPETKSWEPLPQMRQRRKLCSGCFMDNKFYVIGGVDQAGNGLTCGEAFDEQQNTWEFIPNMLKDTVISTTQSPPLVAVANNELYSLESSSNELKLYLKKSNSWKNLGPAPIRAGCNRGWGIAFKSLGDELLVIGASATAHGRSMAVYTCCPDPRADRLQWRALDCGANQLSGFIWNCSVMMA